MATFEELEAQVAELRRIVLEHRHTDAGDTHSLPFSVITNQGSLTPVDTGSTAPPYDAGVADVIDNLRDRQEEIENALIANGILTP